MILGASYSLFFSPSSRTEKTSTIQPSEQVTLLDEADNLSEEIVEPVALETVDTEEVETIKSSTEVSYLTPRRTEHTMQIALEIEEDIITDATILYDNGAASSKSHLSFDAVYEEFVIGANIKTLSLSRVGGASLTSDAYNEAVEVIREQIQNEI